MMPSKLLHFGLLLIISGNKINEFLQIKTSLKYLKKHLF